MESRRIHPPVFIKDLAVNDVLQVKTSVERAIYTIEILDPERCRVNLQKLKGVKVGGLLLGSLDEESGEMFVGQVVLGCRMIFFDPHAVGKKNIQALRVTQKAWLNHELILPAA